MVIHVSCRPTQTVRIAVNGSEFRMRHNGLDTILHSRTPGSGNVSKSANVSTRMDMPDGNLTKEY
jgi:hypothetical protein